MKLGRELAWRFAFARVAHSLVALVALLSAFVLPAATPTVITNFHDFRNRPLQPGEKQRLFRIPAVVTYADAEWKLLFLQDSTEGYSVAIASQPPGVGIGDLVLMQGSQTSVSGNDLSRWPSDTRIRRLGPGRLPQPVAANARSLASPQNAFRRVEVTGVIRSIHDAGRLQLIVLIDGEPFTIWVHHHRPEDLDRLLDARVTVQGVCNQQPGPAGEVVADLLVPNFRSVRVERPGPVDSYGAKLVKIADLLASPLTSTPERVRVKGTVLQQTRGESLLIRDATGELLLHTIRKLSLAKDDVVEATGFPADIEGKRVLKDAEFRVVEASRSSNATAAQADPSLPTLTTIKSVLELTRDQARRRYPVKLRGVVTCSNPSLEALFLQEGEQGICVELGNLNVKLKAGQLVELVGHTLPGGVLTMLAPVKIAVVGETNLPAAKPMTFQEGSSGAYDSRRVEIKGAVQSAVVEQEDLLLDVLGADGRFRCWMPVPPDYVMPTNLLNSVVRVCGVCMVDVGAMGTFQGLSVAIAQPQDLAILETAPSNPFDIPIQSIGDVRRFLPPSAATRLIKVRGVVTLSRPGREMYVQDATGGILVQSAQTNQVEVGDQVEAIGFRAQGRFAPMLQNATFVVVSHGSLLAPLALTASTALVGTNNSELVRIEARLLDNVPSCLVPEVYLDDGQVLFTAAMEPSEIGQFWPFWQAGSLLRVTGVCDLRVDETDRPRSLRLLVRSPADVVVLQKPSWFTTRRLYTLAGFSLLCVVASLGWIRALRRRVQQQTEQIRQRLEREASLEARFRELVENANDIILAYDRSGRILAVNRAAERILGYSREEALRMKTQQIVAPEFQGQLTSRLDGSREPEGTRGTYELGVVTKGGRSLTLELSTRWLGAEAGVARFESIARDVTERRSAEERLRTSEAQLAQAQRIGQVGSWAYVVPTRTLTLSAEARRLLDQAPEATPTPRTLLACLPPTERRGFRVALKHAIRSGGTFDLDHRLVLPRGLERIVHSRVETERGPVGGCERIFGTVQDVTERRGLETQLRQAQKMEALGTLAGGIAHDFNNILAAAIGYLELVRMEVQDRPEVLENLDEVVKANNRATDLVRQILAFSRRGHPQRQPFSLQAAIGESLKLLRSTLPATIQIATELHSQPLTVLGDATQIHQVMMNLCTNAAHAMQGKGGTLTVRLEPVEVNVSFVRTHPELRTGPHAKLVVADTGHGMSEAVLARIYDPFFTTKGPGEGTGLGLSVAHGIVKDHRGAIVVSSLPGVGTTFEIFLPLASGEPTTATALPTAAVSGQGEHILFIDDESAVCQTAGRLLKSWGYQATTQTRPADALRLFQAQPRAFDLVITDLSMPGLSGLDLAAELLKIRPEVPIILSSGNVGALASDWAQRVGIEEILLKPVTPHDLRAVVGRVLRERGSKSHSPR